MRIMRFCLLLHARWCDREGIVRQRACFIFCLHVNNVTYNTGTTYRFLSLGLAWSCARPAACITPAKKHFAVHTGEPYCWSLCRVCVCVEILFYVWNSYYLLNFTRYGKNAMRYVQIPRFHGFRAPRDKCHATIWHLHRSNGRPRLTDALRDTTGAHMCYIHSMRLGRLAD